MLLKKHQTRLQCVPLVRRLLTMIEHPKHAGSPALVQLGRVAYGFHNFENYRLRVKVLRSQVFWDLGSAPICGVEPPKDECVY
jgi:hypothetical protein